MEVKKLEVLQNDDFYRDYYYKALTPYIIYEVKKEYRAQYKLFQRLVYNKQVMIEKKNIDIKDKRILIIDEIYFTSIFNFVYLIDHIL